MVVEGGSHQSLLSLMKGLFEGEGLVEGHDKGINFDKGREIGVGMKKYWGVVR